MKQVSVNITGEQGSGKTTVGVIIRKALEDAGYRILAPVAVESKPITQEFLKSIEPGSGILMFEGGR